MRFKRRDWLIMAAPMICLALAASAFTPIPQTQSDSPFHSMDAPSTAVGLDGEEIETVCELKGLSLRRTYG
jgi:hypothetical protein